MEKQKEKIPLKQRKKGERGITLIALVITIIVLLILAAVSIATLTGQNGILTRANDAKKENEIASVKEQAQLDISNYIAEKLENGEDSTVNTPEKVQEILEVANQNNENKYYKGFTDTGVTTPSGYEVPYEELYTTDSSGEDITAKTIEDLVAGDKVYYDTGNTSVGNQGIIECIVLYDSSSEYGVQIISSNIVSTVTLGDANDFNTSMTAYNNAITTLNAKSEEYQNVTYASDARCVGSVPNKKNAESGNITNLPSYVPSYTFKDEDTNYITDLNQMKALGIKNCDNNDRYWLASRYCSYEATDSAFCVRHEPMIDDDVLNYSYYHILCGVEPNDISEGNILEFNYGLSYGLRPVFTLKPGIKVTEGDGDAIPYTLAP